MPSNKDLIATIKGLDETVETDNKNNAQLVEIAKGLREKATTEAEAQAEAEADTIPPFEVAEGKSITCKKGVIDSGEEVKAEYLPGGEETLVNLIERGFVVEN